MPSRNRKNKNRSNANANANTNKNAASVTTTESTASIGEQNDEVKFTQNITEPEVKLAELQQNVDVVKNSDSPVGAAAVTNIKNEPPSDKSNEQQNDQQTMKKKRNRNRNHKKNSSDVNESGASTTHRTHECSPTRFAPVATEQESITITENTSKEPDQTRIEFPHEKIELDSSKTEPDIIASDKQQETADNAFTEDICMTPNQKNIEQSAFNDADKSETQVDETETVSQRLSESIDKVQIKNDDGDRIVEKESSKSIKKGNTVQTLNDTITTDKMPKIEKQTENFENQSKENVGKCEDKQVGKSSPKMKQKIKNNQNAKESKKSPNETKQIEKKPPERIKPPEPIEITPSTFSKSAQEAEENVRKSETVNIEHTKVADGCATVTNENVTKEPISTSVVATPAPELLKKPIQHEDETAKIWKILEDAAKSLEPVEIQMDDEPMINANGPPANETNIPILCSLKDQQRVEERAKDLTAFLQTSEIDKTIADAQTKPKNESLQIGAILIQTSSLQLQKQVEPIEQPIQIAPELSEVQEAPIPIQDDDTVKKLTEEEREPTRKCSAEILTQEPSLIKEMSYAIPLDDDMIPLDVSILPNHIDVPEMNTDSKNVQGSGFVPSVDQTAAETESLGTIATTNKIETHKNTSVDSNKENALKSMVTQAQDNGSSANANRKDKNKKPKAEIPDQSVAQKEKKPLISKKLNAKPVVPPKPDNLVSSQGKKSQAMSKKSAKMEKILVVTGANANDEDSEDDYIEYKFMPRPVFIASLCQLCKKPTEQNERILCQLCHMVSYCNAEDATNDEPQHRDLCAAFQEISKKRGAFCINIYVLVF